MNNKDYIAELARRTGYKQTDVQAMVHDVLNAMGDRFIEGYVVQIPGFGTFEVKKKLERIIVNPATAQRMLVPPKLVLGFKPAQTWKDNIKKGGE